MAAVNKNKLVADQYFVNDCYTELRILIFQLSLLLGKARDRELLEVGITNVQSAALMYIFMMGKNTTIGILADKLLVENHSASQLVKRMQEYGLIMIDSHKNQRNKKYLKLTPKGKRCLDLAMQKHAVSDLLATIPPEQCQKTIKQLKLIKETILNHSTLNNKEQYP